MYGFIIMKFHIQAEQLGKEFDNEIYTSNVEHFGSESDVDGDGKVNILTYDIQDGFDGSGGYVAGYFSPQDLYTYSPSNHSEIFYIDTYPTMGMYSSKDVSGAYSTLAHEFEHMINFNQKVFKRGNTKSMDVWMDEGLAMAAEQIYLGEALQGRIDYYNYTPNITYGHSLLYWDYYGDTLANYSLSYLFMQYVKEQAGQGNQIFKEIINNKNTNYLAVEEVMQKYNSKIKFGQFMTNFRAALTLKKDSGPYGFKGNPFFDDIKEKIYKGNDTYLQSGGAVVKKLSSESDFSVPANKGENITYTLLSDKDENETTINLTKPIVDEVGDSDISVHGKADKDTAIVITSNGSILGTGYSDKDGYFTISIPRQAAGTNLVIYAEQNGIKSEETTVTVIDKTAPAAPKVNEVSDLDTSVTGTAEANAKITVKKGSTVLRSETVKVDGTFTVTIPKQKAGTNLILYVEDKAGNKSSENNVTVVDKTAPSAPKVNSISDKDTNISGTTEVNATVTVKSGSKILGTTTTDKSGKFKIKIAKQKAGTTLSVYAEDKAKNRSKAVSVKVIDKTAPSKPTVSTFADNQTTINGKAEPASIVTIKSGSKTLGTATTNSKGVFQVKIKSKQKAGTTLTVYAKDKAGNQSGGKSFKVIDKTAPGVPTVNKVTTKSTTVTGKAEKSSTIYLYNGKKKIGKVTVDSKGNYKIKISKQKKGTTLKVYAQDKAGNKSKEKTIKVS